MYKTQGQVPFNLESIAKLKQHLEWCMIQVQQYVKSNPIAANQTAQQQQQQQQQQQLLQQFQAPAASTSMQSNPLLQTQQQQASGATVPPATTQPSVEGFSKEALIAGIKPGLRVEDLKPPPARRKPTGSSPAMHQDSPQAKTPGTLAAGSSPAATANNAGPSPAAPSKVTKQASAAGTPAATALANKKGHARNGSTKYPTQDDIMAAVKRERGVAAGKSDSATPAAGAAATSAASPVRPASVDAAKQRQKELEDAKTDPLPFLKQAWTELTASSSAASDAETTPKAKTPSISQNLAYLPDDVSLFSKDLVRAVPSTDIKTFQLVGHLDLAAEPAIPQPVRDPSELSFVAPQPTLTELGSLEASSNGALHPVLNKHLDSEFDWTIYLNEDADVKQTDSNGTTPELDESRPDELTPSSVKDEAKTPENAQLGKAQLLSKLTQRSPQVAEAELSPSGSSVSSTKRKLSELAVTDDATTSNTDDSSEKRKKASIQSVQQQQQQQQEQPQAFDVNDPDSFDRISWPRADFFKSSAVC